MKRTDDDRPHAGQWYVYRSTESDRMFSGTDWKHEKKKCEVVRLNLWQRSAVVRFRNRSQEFTVSWDSLYDR